MNRIYKKYFVERQNNGLYFIYNNRHKVGSIERNKRDWWIVNFDNLIDQPYSTYRLAKDSILSIIIQKELEFNDL